MIPILHALTVQLERHPREIGFAFAGLLALVAAIGYVVWSRRPTAEELEARRRGHLAAVGRIIDGSILDAIPSEREAVTILYQYRVAGVVYERGQDVSSLSGYLEHLRLDMPVQVRYDAHNPADSIVVSETWNGLWDERHKP